jgi:hypothetical protein
MSKKITSSFCLFFSLSLKSSNFNRMCFGIEYFGEGLSDFFFKNIVLNVFFLSGQFTFYLFKDNLLRYNSHIIQLIHLKHTFLWLLICSQNYTIITIVNFKTFLSTSLPPTNKILCNL